MLKEIIISGISITLLIFSLSRNKVWQDDTTLWFDALKKSPMKPRVLDSAGKSLADKGRFSEAIGYYRKALQIDPSYRWAYHHLIHAYLQLNMPDEALDVIKNSRDRLVEHAGLYRMLINIYIRQQRYTRAQQAYERLIEIEPEELSNYQSYGIFLIERGHALKAIDIFKKALSLSPENASLYNNLGIALEEAGRLKEAEEAYRKALSLEPDAEEPEENLRRLLSKKR